MNRFVLLKTLAQQFGQEFSVTLRPDLPNLIEGPDMLAGRTGDLVAVFIPRGSETRNPQQLTARLGWSRLALPDWTRCILLYSVRDTSLGFRPNDHALHFHAISLIEDLNKTRRVLDDESPGSVQTVPTLTREVVCARSDFLLSLSTTVDDARSYSGGFFADAESDQIRSMLSRLKGPHPGIIGTSHTISKQFALDYPAANVLLAQYNSSPRFTVLQTLHAWSTANFVMNYSMDHGIPYPKSWSATVLVVDGQIDRLRDPFKAVRASALMGVSLMQRSDVENLKHRVDVISKWLEASPGG